MPSSDAPVLLSSLQNPIVKKALALHEKKERRRHLACLVVGEKAISEARQAGWQAQHFFFRDDVLSPHSFSEGTPWHMASLSVLKALADTSSAPPVVGIFDLPETRQEQSFEQSLKALTAPPHSKARLLVLDGIQDPGNLGTLFRSAVAFGIEQVILIAPCADVWSPKVIRSSVGLQFRLSIHTIAQAETPEVLKKLHSQGWQVYLADASDEETASLFLHEFTTERASQPLAFVLGQEGQGLRLSPEEKRDFYTLSIAMQEEAESLNVAITGSILMHHFFTLEGASIDA